MPLGDESLTIRILGDSSHLQRELDRAAERLVRFRAKLGEITGQPIAVDRLAGRFSALARPLERIGTLLDGILRRLDSLSRATIRIDVAPALRSLAALARSLDQVAARMRRISAINVGGGVGPLPFPAPGPVRRFEQGGLVTGPLGTDRVPALLSAGEFVLRRPAVEQLGHNLLGALNRHQAPRAAVAIPSSPPNRDRSAASPGNRLIPADPRSPSHAPVRAAQATTSPSHTVNNFGGITLNVTGTMDLDAVVRDLQRRGARLRNRRG